MPEKETLDAAKQDLEEGKSPSTAAGEFVREEIEHVREEAWRAVGETGDRYWIEQGPEGWDSAG